MAGAIRKAGSQLPGPQPPCGIDHCLQKDKAGRQHYLRISSKSLAREFAPDGVCVNALCPGGIDTPMGRQGFPDPEWRAHFDTNVPLRRAGLPEEVARAIIFLVSDWSSYTTGHTLDVEGGLLLR
ncbi:MAG: SDR family oxidoreductase [Betaproteobacteria bacterium]|nr:SDR family oxidoreductase [Betaproteobacteria bacterium]NDE42117.1 SDR family oxidoreductase [Betaproteobacteria bacterium]